MKNLTAIRNLGFLATSVKVDKVNPIIFKSTIKKYNLTVDDGKSYILDVDNNDAVEVTPKSVTKAFEASLLGEDLSDTDNDLAYIGEKFNLLTEVTLKRDTNADIILSLDLDTWKVTAADIAVQNQIIFDKVAVGKLSGLTKDAGKYYQLDLDNNTATVIDPESIATQAKADLLDGNHTDLVDFVHAFGLISSISLTKIK